MSKDIPLELARPQLNGLSESGSTKASLGKSRTPRVSDAIVFILLCLAVLPIGVSIDGFSYQLALADLAAAFLLPYVLLGKNDLVDYRIFVIGVALSFVALLVLSAADGSFVQPTLTLGFFWKPWILYFAARRFISGSQEPHARLGRLLVGVGVALFVGVSMIIAAWMTTGHLTSYTTPTKNTVVLGFTSGSWDYPLKTYGWGQVNNTAALLVVAIAIFFTIVLMRTGWARLMGLTGAAASTVVIIESGSRGALISAGLLIAVCFTSRALRGRRLSVAAFIAAIALFCGTLIFLPEILAASPKYLNTISALETGNSTVKELTSGRSEIFQIMLADIAKSPIVGTGFGDFSRFHPLGDPSLLETSPHNTYIGPFHKGGLLVGVPYVALALRALPLRKFRIPEALFPLQWPLTIAMLLGMFMVTDMFTTPVASAALLIVFGMMRSLELLPGAGVGGHPPGGSPRDVGVGSSE